jgi:hypothetical protein
MISTLSRLPVSLRMADVSLLLEGSIPMRPILARATRRIAPAMSRL